MAVDTRTWGNVANNDSDFRIQATRLHDALIAAGLVQTADTGQVDLTTVVKPGTVNTAAGYRIYRFNDALQATKPVFIKVEFATGANAAHFGSYITVGIATDGAGSITGTQNSGRITMHATTSSATTGTATLFTSGANNRLAMAFVISNVMQFFLTIERTKDADGTESGDAILAIMQNSSGNVTLYHIPYIGSGITSAAGNDVIPGYAFGQTATATDVDVSQIAIPVFGLWKFSWHFNYRLNELSSWSVFSMSAFGAPHTYIVCPFLVTGSRFGANGGLLMLWE